MSGRVWVNPKALKICRRLLLPGGFVDDARFCTAIKPKPVLQIICVAGIGRSVPIKPETFRGVHIRSVTGDTEFNDDVFADLHHERIRFPSPPQKLCVSAFLPGYKIGNLPIAARQPHGFRSENETSPGNLIQVFGPELEPPFFGMISRGEYAEDVP